MMIRPSNLNPTSPERLAYRQQFELRPGSSHAVAAQKIAAERQQASPTNDHP
jgi:hypothetical protein